MSGSGSGWPDIGPFLLFGSGSASSQTVKRHAILQLDILLVYFITILIF